MRKKDFYFKQAKLHNYRSRAAYKIEEILERFSELKRGDNFIELGSFPGGWTQVLRASLKGEITALDLQDMTPIDGVKFYCTDFLQFQTDSQYDCIFSDMAPNTTSDKEGDHFRIVDLLYSVLEFCKIHLKRGGNCVMKSFAGPDDNELLAHCKTMFKSVRTFKPKSSLKESKEFYIVCLYYI